MTLREAAVTSCLVFLGSMMATFLTIRSSETVSAQRDVQPTYMRFYIESVDKIGEYQTVFVVKDGEVGECHAVLESRFTQTQIATWAVPCRPHARAERER